MRNSKTFIQFTTLTLCGGLVLTGCESGSLAERGPSSRIMSPEDDDTGLSLSIGPVKGIDLFDVVVVAKTIRKYRDLTPEETKQVQVQAQKQFNQLVEAKQKTTEPQVRKKRTQIESQKARKIETARKRHQAPAPAAGVESPPPSPALKQELSSIESEAKQLQAELDREWKSQAVASVKKDYGSTVAVPVKNPDNLPVVAFASIQADSVVVTPAAYVLHVDPDQIAKSSGKIAKVDHEGSKYAVLNDPRVKPEF